jgi:hypothetical protein
LRLRAEAVVAMSRAEVQELVVLQVNQLVQVTMA